MDINIAEVRRELGLTQPEFAARLGGVDVSTVHRWEVGKSTPRGPTRELILRILNEHRAAQEAAA